MKSVALHPEHSQDTLRDVTLLVVPTQHDISQTQLSNYATVIEMQDFLVMLAGDTLPRDLTNVFVVIRHDFTPANQFEPFLPKGVHPSIFAFVGATLLYQTQHDLWMVMASRRSSLKCSEMLSSTQLFNLITPTQAMIA